MLQPIPLPNSATRLGKKETISRNEKSADIRLANMQAAREVSDAIRTNLGPRAMDKMIEDSRGEVIISNDGATILKELNLKNPIARMLVDLSKSQDIEAGDGTTTVVVMAGALLEAAEQLYNKGIHPQRIAQAFRLAAQKAIEVLDKMALPVDLNDRQELIDAATTSLSSKIVAQNAAFFAPLAVDAVLKVTDLEHPEKINLSDIRIVRKMGGTLEDSELVEGIVLGDQHISRGSGGPTKMANAKIGLIQFCISPPKTDLQSQITLKDYQAMDRLRREERTIIAKMVKQIHATGCNVLLIQKSILRDAVTDLSLDFLAKAKIMVIKDIEREDIEFISRSTGATPVASLDQFTSENLGSASLVSEENLPVGGRVTRIIGVPNKRAVSFLCRASNSYVLEELDRSFHDALCVVRSLVKHPAVVPGGGCPEMEVSQRLLEWSRTLPGVDQLSVRRYAEALQLIPSTLAENAGLNPVETVTELIAAHSKGQTYHGVNVKGGARVANMKEQRVLQPLLVTKSAINLATEVTMLILKIDDVLFGR
eukprot:GHVP01069773.1.p1 GENE.GHVP01069773.1~~GHVP01069773.1.p1  ORF type:complete len:539 (+),score=110.08 GHVP01069773.1:664-2280(+)